MKTKYTQDTSFLDDLFDAAKKTEQIKPEEFSVTAEIEDGEQTYVYVSRGPNLKNAIMESPKKGKDAFDEEMTDPFSSDTDC